MIPQYSRVLPNVFPENVALGGSPLMSYIKKKKKTIRNYNDMKYKIELQN